VQSKDAESVQFLLDLDAEPNDQPGNFSPLHRAAAAGSKKIVKMLLDKGAEIDRLAPDPEAPFTCDTIDGYLSHGVSCTPLSLAAWKSDKEMARLLLSLDADPTVHSTRDKNTPLHYAVERGDFEVVSLLLQTDSEINAENEMGQTPLDLATILWFPTDWKIAKVLKEHGAVKSWFFSSYLLPS